MPKNKKQAPKAAVSALTAPKPVAFWGSALKDLRAFPSDARQDCGYQIDRVQHGLPPDNFKPMAIVGQGVEEICVTADDGWFRVMYTARLEDAVHVLHVFQKKTNQTSPQDIELGKKRFKELMKSRQERA